MVAHSSARRCLQQPRAAAAAATRSPRRTLATSAVVCAASAALLLGASAFVGAGPVLGARSSGRVSLRAGAISEAPTEEATSEKMGHGWRLGVGRAIDVLRRDTTALFDGTGDSYDLSIFSEDIEIVDARLPSFQLKGLATYERILSTLHWSIKTTCVQSRMEITSVTPPVHNEVYMRWRLHLFPRDVLGDARGFLENLGASDRKVGMPIIFEGYSRYEFHPWTAEIVKHTIDITNPPMYLTDLIKQYTPNAAWMTPATHGLGVPMPGMRIGGADALLQTAPPAPAEGQGSNFAGKALATVGGASSTAPAAREAKTARQAGWLPSMPQSCEDDFECNDGKANFPLQCCELPLIGSFCCEPDDFERAPETPAYVPIPVPVKEWDRQQKM